MGSIVMGRRPKPKTVVIPGQKYPEACVWQPTSNLLVLFKFFVGYSFLVSRPIILLLLLFIIAIVFQDFKTKTHSTPRKIESCETASAYYARLSRAQLTRHMSKTPTRCLRAELEKMGISTRGLWTAALVDAYLDATELSARPHEYDLRFDAASARASARSECVMLWGRCWSQLRYK